MFADDTQAIKVELQKNVIHVNSFEQVDILLLRVSGEDLGRKYIVFESHALKNYFLENSPKTIINCNSSFERFCDDMALYGKDIIFNNLNYCNDFDILNILRNTNNILIQ